MSIRIAEVVCTFPPYKGGTGKAALDNSMILHKAGHQVVVFTPWFKKEKISNKFPFKVKRLPPILKYGNAAFLPQLFWKLKKFDIIHLHLPFYGTAEIIWFLKKIGVLKSKIIATYHQDALGDGWQGKVFDFHAKHIMPKILNSTEKVIVSSFDYAENSKIKNSFKKYEDKFIELPFSIDLNYFKKRDKNKNLIKEYNIKEEEKILLFIGGLDSAHYFKGVNNLIKAFYKVLKNFKNSRLIIIGDGNLRFEYEQIAFNFGLRDKVVFAGKVSDKKKAGFLNLADVFALPSINMGEAFGIVLLEAMASSVPVIASNLPGVRNLARNKTNGFLVEPGDVEGLKEKIEKFFSDVSLAEKFGQAGRKIAEDNYNEKKISNKLTKIFENVYKKK